MNCSYAQHVKATLCPDPASVNVREGAGAPAGNLRHTTSFGAGPEGATGSGATESSFCDAKIAKADAGRIGSISGFQQIKLLIGAFIGPFRGRSGPHSFLPGARGGKGRGRGATPRVLSLWKDAPSPSPKLGVLSAVRPSSPGPRRGRGGTPYRAAKTAGNPSPARPPEIDSGICRRAPTSQKAMRPAKKDGGWAGTSRP